MPNTAYDEQHAIIDTFGSVPQSAKGKPQACAGTSFGSETFIKRDFSLKVA